MGSETKSISRYVRPATTLTLIIVLWWVVTATKWINPLFMPSLDALGTAFAKVFAGSDLYVDAIATTSRALLGLLLSVSVAVPLGLVFGRFPALYEFVELPADFFRSIPSSALFFLFVLFFGIGDASKVAVVFYGCSLIMLVNTVYGAKPTREKQDRINMLRSFDASPSQIFYLAVLRDALPHIAAGLRVCASLSLVLVIITEMFLSATNGLGRRIYDYYLAYRVPEMYVVIIVLGLLGYVVNKLCSVLERRTSFWIPSLR